MLNNGKTRMGPKEEPIDVIKMKLRRDVEGDFKGPLLAFIEMLSKEEEGVGVSSLEMIIREAKVFAKGKAIIQTSDLETFLFSPRLNPALQDTRSSSSGSSSKVALKIKIYMGHGWKQDFPRLDLYAPPDLYVKVRLVAGDHVRTTKVVRNSWEPRWGEEFIFTSVDPGADVLSVEAYDRDQGEDGFAGRALMSVSQLRPGTRTLPLRGDDQGITCTSTSLLVRFTLA